LEVASSVKTIRITFPKATNFNKNSIRHFWNWGYTVAGDSDPERVIYKAKENSIGLWQFTSIVKRLPNCRSFSVGPVDLDLPNSSMLGRTSPGDILYIVAAVVSLAGIRLESLHLKFPFFTKHIRHPLLITHHLKFQELV
jgi:hypothetical protein